MEISVSERVFHTSWQISWLPFSPPILLVFVLCDSSVSFFFFFLSEPRFLIDYIQNLKSSERSLKEQVGIWLIKMCVFITCLQSQVLSWFIFLISVGNCKEKRSFIHCTICQTGTGNGWVEGDSFSIHITCFRLWFPSLPVSCLSH